MSQPSQILDDPFANYSITDEDLRLSQVGIEDELLPDTQKDHSPVPGHENPSSLPYRSIFGGPIADTQTPPTTRRPEESGENIRTPQADTDITDSIETVDDDIMIIDMEQASAVAQDIWENNSSAANPFAATGTAVHVKTEPGLAEPPLQLTPREIQQAMLQRIQRKNKTHHPPFNAKSRAPKPSKQRSWDLAGTSEIKKERRSSGISDHQDNDNSWMEQPDDSGENEEIRNLRILRNSLEAREDAGLITVEDEVELMKIKRKLGIFEKRGELGKRDTMFISSDEDNGVEGVVRHAEEDCKRKIYEDDESAHEVRSARDLPGHQEAEIIEVPTPIHEQAKRTSDSKRKVAKTSREVAENRRAREEAKEAKKRRKKAAAKAKISKRQPEAKKSQRKAISHPSATPKSLMNGSNEDSLIAIIKDLRYNDAVADRAAQSDYGEGPIIDERSNKATQLKLLLASVPEDLDTHRRKADMKDLKKATMSFGYGKVKPENGFWKLKGMSHSLYHHQLIGSHWMIGRELSLEKPKGGLLADAMGLGKTLEMIATMIGNPPSKADIAKRRRATLIVMPSSAIKQWKEEISIHADTDVFRRILHYRAKMEIDQNVLEDCDIVLTSYAEVMGSLSWPSPEKMKTLAQEGGIDAWCRKSIHLAGTLHQVPWYRVVLDEAHAIKNFAARTSVACQWLKGRYRWAMTGTPIHNRIQELFPYFRFLGADWTGDLTDFKKNYCNENSDNNLRITVLLGIVMMRRTMKDKILGRPIVNLPQSHPETVYVHFTSEEKVIYRILEDRFRHNLNIHFAQGEPARNYNIFMVQLLRLRQCTAHPFLLEQTIKDLFTLEDLKRLKRELAPLSRMKTPVYAQIQQWVQTTVEREAAGDVDDTAQGSSQRVPFGRSDFGKYFRMDKHFASLSEKALHQKLICRICGDLPCESQITDCQHIFCKECIEIYVQRAAQEDDFHQIECPACLKMLSEMRPYKNLELRSDDEEDCDRASSRGPVGQGCLTGHAKDLLGNEPKTPPSTWLSISLNAKELPPPSAKTVFVKALILRWLRENREDKILIFTQFRMMTKVLGLVIDAEKVGFVYYTGDMNQNQRHEAVKEFHNNPNCQVMISGLRCGGQALNLTCANRVISIDVWFNHCVEQQAFGRVFRIGQRKETHFQRIVVRNSVDQRLLSLQAEKVNLVDRAMQDDGRVAQTLDIKELASLFGHLSNDADGNICVNPDYDD